MRGEHEVQPPRVNGVDGIVSGVGVEVEAAGFLQGIGGEPPLQVRVVIPLPEINQSVDGVVFFGREPVEVAFGLTEREFNSFLEASEEAAISRLYGGIHYMMAIDNGVDQGERVGEFIVSKLVTDIRESSLN